MDSEKLYSVVSELITKEFGVPAENVKPKAELVQELGLDSIDMCDALVHLETMTGKPLPLEKYRAVVTIEDFVDTTLKLVA